MAEIPFPGRQVAPQVVETYKQPFSQAAGRKEEYLAGQAYQEAERIQRGFQIASGLFSLSGQTIEFVQGLRLASDAGAVARKEAQASLEVAQFLQNMAINPEGDPDWNLKVGEKYQEFQDELYGRLSEGFKTKEGQQNFEISFQKIANKAKLDVNEFAWKSTFEKIKMDYFTALDAAVETQNHELLQKNLLDAFNHGVFTADEIRKHNDDYEKKYHLKTLDIVAGEARIKGPEAGIPWVNSPEARQKYPDLTSDEWKEIEKGIRSDAKYEKDLESDRHQKARGEQMSQAQSDLWGGKLKPSVVKNINELKKQWPDLEDEDQRTLVTLYDKMESEAEARKKGQNLKSDPSSELEAMNIVLSKTIPKLEKETRIRNLKGLITDDTWKWLQRVNPSEMEKTLLAPLQISYETIMKDPEAATRIEDLLILNNTINAVYDWMVKNPDATFLQGKKFVTDYVGEIEKTRKTKKIKTAIHGYYELSRGERKTLEKSEAGKPPGEKAPEVKPPAAAAPKLEENEVIVVDKKTGERFAYNKKTGKKRKL